MRSRGVARRLLPWSVALLLVVASAAPAAATAGPGETWPSFNESYGCDQPAGFYGPRMPTAGYQPDTAVIYGPWGDFFGRTIGDVRSQLVKWTVPLSDTPGFYVYVHRLALPAFELAAKNIAAGAAAHPGQPYVVHANETFGFSPRTARGKINLSFHAIGTAVDINSRENPYSLRNVKVYDMPAWFIQAWKDAGFCWGGDWHDLKDTMHFSWKGPAATPGYGTLPALQPPRTASAPFTTKLTSRIPILLPSKTVLQLLDASRDGATDLYRLRSWDGGTLIEFARSSSDFAQCNVGRWWSPAPFDPAMEMGDVDGTSRHDLWRWDTSKATLSATVFTHASGFAKTTAITTAIPVTKGMETLLGDFDADGLPDIWIIRPGKTTTVEVWTGAGAYKKKAASATIPVDSSGAAWFTLGDRNLDNRPDLVAATPSGKSLQVRFFSATKLGTVAETDTVAVDPSTVRTLSMGNIDGDGRADLLVLTTSGHLLTFLGGVPDGRADLESWFRDPAWTCPTSGFDMPSKVASHLPRLAGADRYGTSAAVSAATFPAGVPVAFVAGGLDFPDALTAGPLAAVKGGPVLLTAPDHLPASTAAELKRLQPGAIVVVGGTAAVSGAVANQLAAYTAGSVSRLAGADRYATAAAVAAKFPTKGTVYVATGENFPDALAAGPSAARSKSPIVLVLPNRISPPTDRALRRLAPSRIVVLGGSGAVSDAVVSALARYTSGSVERLAGADRYSTAAAVAAALDPQPTRVFVTTGTDFPDAVSSAAAAAKEQAEILLVRSGSLPSPTASTLRKLRPAHVDIVGGAGVVGEVVREILVDYVWPS